MHAARLTLVLLAAALTLSACGTSPTFDPRTWFKREGTPAPVVRDVPGVDARLRPLKSSVNGNVRLRESGDLLVAFVDLSGLQPGVYRVVLHANGNCNSPNGFSAGDPWSPPGWREPATRLFPEVYANSGGIAQLTARVRGVRLGDAVTRSVLIYAGTSPQIPRPDVENNAVACGVFAQSATLF